MPDDLLSYLEVHELVRGITGFGTGNGPYIAIHDGFAGVSNWAGLLTGTDRVVLDTHPYFAFDGSDNTAPIGEDGTGGTWPATACNAWGSSLNERYQRYLSFDMMIPSTNDGKQSNGVWSDHRWGIQHWIQRLWVVLAGC
jgi:hypothetical protein